MNLTLLMTILTMDADSASHRDSEHQLSTIGPCSDNQIRDSCSVEESNSKLHSE